MLFAQALIGLCLEGPDVFMPADFLLAQQCPAVMFTACLV